MFVVTDEWEWQIFLVSASLLKVLAANVVAVYTAVWWAEQFFIEVLFLLMSTLDYDLPVDIE